MKIELHCHTTRYSPCALATPYDMMNALVAHDYDAVFITEHDSVWTHRDLKQLRSQFPRLRIFPGIELSLDGCHLLVLGTNDYAYLEIGSAAGVIAKARRQGLLTVLAHPFRWPGGDALLHTDTLPDAIEFRTNNHDAIAGRKSQLVADHLHLPTVNAGDTHAIEKLNHYWIETGRDIRKPRDLRTAILEGDYRNCEGKVEVENLTD